MGEIIDIITWNNGIAACAFLLVIVNFLKKLIKHQKIFDFELIVVFIIGAATLFFSYKQNQSDQSEKSGLSKKIDVLLSKRNIDSSNTASFQKYLKDTFGIITKNNKPIIYNIKTYYSKAQNLSPKSMQL